MQTTMSCTTLSLQQDVPLQSPISDYAKAVCWDKSLFALQMLI